MEQLGKSLPKSSTRRRGGVDIQQTLDKLNTHWSKLERQWISRKSRLEQGVELQRWNQEADRIEAGLSGHEARLMITDQGVRSAQWGGGGGGALKSLVTPLVDCTTWLAGAGSIFNHTSGWTHRCMIGLALTLPH